MTIFIAALLITGIAGITSAKGMQSALGGDNCYNELKIKQGANENNNCD
jgi:hypothetical protein